MNEAAKSGQASSLIAVLVSQAAAHPDRTAYHFIGDNPESDIKLSYRQLLQEAISLAVSLQLMQLPGKPVLLVCKSNMFTIIGFYACLMAGALPVPTAPPRRPALAERIRFIATQSGAAAVLTDSDAMLDMQIDLPMMDLRHGRPCASDPPRPWHEDGPPTDQPALILYTSGAGGDPHGVVHSQASLMAASRAMGISFGHDAGRSAILLSLPLFHETGLMLGVIHPMAAGVPVYLMTPAQFVQRPDRWLQLIEQLRITTTGGPNFMFDLLIREVEAGGMAPLDLSGLRAFFCSGEPVRAGTMDRLRYLLQASRLRPEAILPCYSLAEAGRHVTGSVGDAGGGNHGGGPKQLAPGRAGLVHPLVSCGKPHIDCRLLVVNPARRCVVANGDLGEIWLQCASLALGYWNEPALTAAVFGARLQDGDGGFLRTGDLGMLRDGELYVLGRLDDRIRIGGADHAPAELELQVERSHAGLRPSCAAVFSVEFAGRSRLVVVCELKREMLRCREKWPHIESAIRSAIRRVHGLAVDDMVLLAPGALPKTSSGKVRRRQCRDDYLAGRLMLASTATAE